MAIAQRRGEYEYDAERAVCLFGNGGRGETFAVDEHHISERICLDVQLLKRVE